MYRNSYVMIDTKKIYDNVSYIRKNYDYEYYFGVVKNNAYGHGIEIVNSLIKAGVNYLAVSSLDEALEIREKYAKIPILVLEPVPLEYIDKCVFYNITVTVESLKYLNELEKINFNGELIVHLKVDSGMNRLGFNDKDEFTKAYGIIANSKKICLEGVYTHFATTGLNDSYYKKQIAKFEEVTQNINLNTIKIVHMDRSLTFINNSKIPYCNGVRLGILMYGITGRKPILSKKQQLKNKIKKLLGREVRYSKILPLNTAFELYSEVMSLRKVQALDSIGYNCFKVMEDALIATIPIGYADGVDCSFKYVYINGMKCPIVSDCMDMIMVIVPNKTKIGDKVEILGKNISIVEACSNTGLNSYHLFNKISHRVERRYK